MQQYEFQADIQKALDILVHSLYTKREVFLRELLSNASDALEKAQFQSLTHTDESQSQLELEIYLSFDKDKGILTIEDHGIGMIKEELIQNLGSIAGSGTQKFLEELKEKNQSSNNLIGQFGVGFYSAFMVADRIEFDTLAMGGVQAWRWSSEGNGTYSIEQIEKKDRGSVIRLFLKEDAKEEFCNEQHLERIVQEHSNYIPFPIKYGDRILNEVKAIWTASKQDTSKEDYEKFYNSIAHDYRPPRLYYHFSIDAPIQYYGLFFIPEDANNEIIYAKERGTINIYSQRVIIQQNADLLPQYLRFVSGVIDSEDLPLNVSRESVQHNAVLEKIKKNVVSKLLGEFKNLANSNSEGYTEFWKRFGNFLKEGCHSDFGNREKITELLRFDSSIFQEEGSYSSLKEYVSRIREDQKEIYYLSGASRQAVLHNPNLEYFKKQGIETLLLYDPIDEFVITDLREYDGKTFKSITDSDLETSQDDATTSNLSEDTKKKVLDRFQQQLEEHVSEVVESKRLVDSPCSLVQAKDGMSPHLEKMMQSMNQNFTLSKKRLELNLNHELVQNLSQLIDQNKEENFVDDCIQHLFQMAQIAEGALQNPHELLPIAHRVMQTASQLHLNKDQ